MEPSGNVLALIRQNIHILILLLILNIIPPQLLMNLLENSITSRLSRLEKVFNQIDSDVQNTTCCKAKSIPIFCSTHWKASVCTAS